MMRKLIATTVVASVVLVGLVVQAGSYLLALPSDAARESIQRAGTLGFGQPGPHPVGVRQLSEEEAPIPMTVWYPGVDSPTDAGATTYSYSINMLGPDTSIALATYDGIARRRLSADQTSGPYPLVVLSHGFAISPGSYGWLAEYVASHGFVVVAPDHEESLDPGTLWESTIQRPRDIQATLEYLEDESRTGGQLDRIADIERLAVVGHSYGGHSALAAAGARFDSNAFEAICEETGRDGEPLTFLCGALIPKLDEMSQLLGLEPGSSGLWPSSADPRVDAVVSIAGDAAMFGDLGLSEVKVPVLLVGGTADTDSPFQWATQLSYDNVSSSRRAEVAFEGAGHMVFAGACQNPRRIVGVVGLGFCSEGVWETGHLHGLVSHYVTAFLESELLGDVGAAAELGSGGRAVDGVGFRSEGY